MKIYLDLQKQAITKTTDEKTYEGDFYSNVFEVLFYNYTDTTWFPTMSQLAPNGRKAGEFTADALEVGESHTYVEDGVTYLKFDFTMGASWVLMKGRSEFYIWFNRLGGAIVQKKCVGVVNVMIDQSTTDYFIADPTFNPNVKAYIDKRIDDLDGLEPSGVATSTTILAYDEDKGIWVGSDTGDWYYWNGTQYVSGGTYITQRLLLATVDLSEGVLVKSGNVYVVDSAEVTNQIKAMCYRFRFTDEIFPDYETGELFQGTIIIDPIYEVPIGNLTAYIYGVSGKLGDDILTANISFIEDNGTLTIQNNPPIVYSHVYNQMNYEYSINRFGLSNNDGVINSASFVMPKINNNELFNKLGACSIVFTEDGEYLDEISITFANGGTTSYKVFNDGDLENIYSTYAKKNDPTQEITAKSFTATTAVGTSYTSNGYTNSVKFTTIDIRKVEDSGMENIYLLPYVPSGAGYLGVHELADTTYVNKRIQKYLNDLRWELGSHTLDVSSDTTTSFSKSVPANTIGCQINTLGGMSYKSENLSNITDVAETTTNGITYSVSDVVVALDGTTTAITTIILQYPISLPAGTYTWALFNASTCYNSSLSPLDDNLRVELRSGGSPIVSSQVFFDSVNKTKTFTTTSSADAIYIRMSSGLTIPNFTFKPMLVSGSTAPTTFKTYFSGIRDSAVTSVVSKDSNNTTIDTRTIPSQIQALTGYGWGINDTCYNYIDFDRKVFAQNVCRVDLGTLNWSYDRTVERFTAIINDLKYSTTRTAKFLCAIYQCLSNQETFDINWDNVIYNAVGEGISRVAIHNHAYTDATTFTTAMNGVYLYYELATPIETDVSQYLTTDTIDVEPLGTLEFTNTYNNDVPSDIDYLIEEVKA